MTLQMVERYSHLSPDHKRQAIERLQVPRHAATRGYRNPSQGLQQPLRRSFLVTLRQALADAVKHGQEKLMPSPLFFRGLRVHLIDVKTAPFERGSVFS